MDEESAFIELLKQEKLARLAGDVMVTGEVRFTRMTLQLNQQFHDKHPQQYKRRSGSRFGAKSRIFELYARMFWARSTEQQKPRRCERPLPYYTVYDSDGISIWCIVVLTL
jgi:hypothetical protein